MTTRPKKQSDSTTTPRSEIHVNDQHAIARKETSRRRYEALFIILYIPFAAAATLAAGVTAPGWILFQNGSFVNFDALRSYLAVFAVDSNGLAGFLAFGGFLVALNHFNGAKSSEMDSGAAVQLFVYLKFRNAVQWAAVAGVSAAPLGGLIWVLINTHREDWAKSTFSIIVVCLALWAVVLLSIPPKGYFGLQSVADEWTLNHTAFLRDTLALSWGERWGLKIQSAPHQGRHPFRLAIAWSIVALAATVGFGLLAATLDPETSVWDDPLPWLTLLMFFLFNVSLVSLVVVISTTFVSASTSSHHQGRYTGAKVYKALAILISPTVAALFALQGYWPFTIMIWAICLIQTTFVFGLLRQGRLSWRWFPVRGLVMLTRSWLHQQTHLKWERLDRSLEKGLRNLPRQARKRKEKEIAAWQKRIQAEALEATDMA